MKSTFDELVSEALAAHFEGWDFSWLAGRRTDYSLPWDYAALVKSRMRGIDSMLDVGAGGGEVLASLTPFPPHVYATEAFPPNVVIARERLEPLGVDLRDTSGDPNNQNLPFDDGSFDLVINRQDSYLPAEVFRILRPGGHFVTQQCGGYGEVDLIEYFKGKIEPFDWTAEVASKQLEEAGFEIIDSQEVYPKYSFLDIGAVVYTFRAIPWLLNDFTVEKYRDRLLEMHEHIQKHGGFTVKDQRFLIEARKPEVPLLREELKTEEPLALEVYEQIAEKYAETVDSKPHNAYCERPAMLSLLPDVRGKRVLDCGCGSGSYSEWLMRHGAAKVVAFDMSPKLVEIARKRLGDKVEVRLADLSKPLDFMQESSVDVVICPLVLDYIENWEPVFCEFRRVLNKNGSLLFSYTHPLSSYDVDRDKDYFKIQLVESKWPSFGVTMPFYRRSLNAVTSALKVAGFFLESIIQAEPTQECRQRDSRAYARLRMLPTFICVRARIEEEA